MLYEGEVLDHDGFTIPTPPPPQAIYTYTEHGLAVAVAKDHPGYTVLRRQANAALRPRRPQKRAHGRAQGGQASMLA